jgi:hypothetical protein
METLIATANVELGSTWAPRLHREMRAEEFKTWYPSAADLGVSPGCRAYLALVAVSDSLPRDAHGEAVAERMIIAS